MERSWKLRRRVVFGTLAFCGAVILLMCTAALMGVDTALGSNIVFAVAGLAGTVATGYLGFATWDDKQRGKERMREHDNAKYD